MDVTIYDGSPNTGMEGLADRFRRSVSALFACFALDCRPSFEEIGDLIKRYANVADLDLNLLPVVLVGLKADLPESDRQVTRAEAEAKASEFDCPYVEVSSLTGVGLNEAVVELLTRELHSRAQREEARNAYRKAHRRACATM